MKIVLEVKLKDERFCDGCPLYYDTIQCLAGFEGFEEQNGKPHPDKEDALDDLRPRECLEKFGGLE